jgi:hypothetical protein
MLYRGDNRIQDCSTKNRRVFGLGSSFGEPQAIQRVIGKRRGPSSYFAVGKRFVAVWTLQHPMGHVNSRRNFPRRYVVPHAVDIPLTPYTNVRKRW